MISRRKALHVVSARRRQRQSMFRRQKGRCHYCGCICSLTQGYARSMTVDHVIPLSRGGNDAPGNRIGACRSYNSLKGSMMPDTFRRLLDLAGSADPQSVRDLVLMRRSTGSLGMSIVDALKRMDIPSPQRRSRK